MPGEQSIKGHSMKIFITLFTFLLPMLIFAGEIQIDVRNGSGSTVVSTTIQLDNDVLTSIDQHRATLTTTLTCKPALPEHPYQWP